MQANRFAVPRRAALGAVLLFVGACATETKTTNVWLNQALVSGPPRNVVVFGAQVDPGIRRTLEDGLVASLRERGLHAEPSYAIFPDQLPPRDQAREQVMQRGFDSILVSRMRGVKDQVSYVSDGSAMFWDSYYGPAGWGGGYVVNDTYVRFETTFWDAKKGDMIWAASTQTVNPTSGKDFVTSLDKELMKRMEDAGLVGHKPKS
jgi:hypothetical protein